MKIVKKLSPIMESISNVGKNKKKELKEELDVNHPIGVLPHADAVATEQHIADRAAGLERRANPDKDPLVKELIDETASAKSRTLHYDVVDRKGLAKILTEAKKNKQKFKVGKSDKLGYRYFVDILPIYGSKGALEVDDDITEVDGEEAGESLSESLTLNEDIEQELKDYIKWCKDNGKEPKDGASLDAYFEKDKKLDEAKYKTPMNESEDYINAMYKAYKELSKRKGGYAAVYGYRKGKTFVPFLALKDSQEDLKKLSDSLKTREKGQNDVIVYTLFKDNLEGAKELLKNKGLLKENLSIDNLLDDELEEPIDNNLDEETEIIYQVSLISYPDIEETEEFDNQEDAIKYAKENQADYDEVVVEKITTNYIDREDRETIYEGGKELDHYEDLKEDYDDFDYYVEQLEELDLDENAYDYYLEKLYEIADEDEYASYKSFADVLKDARKTAEQYKEDESNMIDDEDEDLDEDLQLYTSSLKDFKPAKEAEELWNEIIEKGKMDDLEYALENVFKSDDDKNASIDIEGLNDLLVNHPDFIRTLIGLDDAPLEDIDYDSEDVEPVDNDDLIIDDVDEEEPVDVDTPINDEDEEDIIDYKKDKIEADDEEDIEPLTDQELADEDVEEYPEAPKYVDEEPKEEKKPSKWTKREDKVEEALGDKEEKQKKIDALRAKLKEDCGCDHPCDREPELKLDDENDDLEECNKPIKECDTSKDDDLTETIANAYVKSRVTEAKPQDKQDEYDSLVKKTLPLLESDEEIVDISDDEINQMVGAPTEADVKKECKECDENKPVEDKKPLEEACEEKKEEIKEEVKPAEEDKKVEECKEQPIKEECKDEKIK